MHTETLGSWLSWFERRFRACAEPNANSVGPFLSSIFFYFIYVVLYEITLLFQLLFLHTGQKPVKMGTGQCKETKASQPLPNIVKREKPNYVFSVENTL